MTKYGCHNRPAFKPTIEVQNGWTTDGRRIMVEKPFRMTRHCSYDLKKEDKKCAGCYWIDHEDY